MTNFIDNGHFETDTDGWSAYLSATIARSTSNPYVGDACCRISASSTAYSGMEWGFGGRTFTSGVTYRFRLAAQKISGASDTWYFELYDRTGTSTVASSTFTAPAGWSEFTFDWTPGADYDNLEAGIYHVAASVAVLAADDVAVYEAADDDPLAYDEATLSPSDEAAFTITTVKEPQANSVGVSTGGALEALTDFMNFGVLNGNFRKGPPDPSASITSASSAQTASNFLPDWRFQNSSNTNVTATQARDVSSPSGSNFRFSFANGGTVGDEAYIEQIIDIGGSRRNATINFLRTTYVYVSGSASATVTIAAQYLTTDGTITGMPAEATGSSGVMSSAQEGMATVYPGSASVPPKAARYLRVRVRVRRTAATTAFVVDIADVRRDSGRQVLLLADLTDSPTILPAEIQQSAGIVYVQPQLGDELIVGPKLMALTFVRINIPAAATTSLETPFTGGVTVNAIPWGGSIVGVSYRMDGVLTAGTMDVRARVNGADVWTAFALTTASAQTAAVSQNIGTDTFAAGDNVGVNVVTNGAFLPTTRDIVVNLWLAINYNGT